MIYKIYKTNLGKRHIMHTYEQLHVKQLVAIHQVHKSTVEKPATCT